ncbi:MAG TPA: hypothetical protein PKK06_17915 [Phycisphaerae bacterium]|nr:hypothetical protein [Phycisphaerae bacterium]HNU47087.1 hypothetical protein [Phycisphaerae bacterium]
MSEFASGQSRRPKLIPLAVPWCIDALRANFSMVTGEYHEHQPTELGFNAYALGQDRAGPFEMQVIRVTFQEALAARVCPFEDEDVLLYAEEEPAEGLEDGLDGFQRNIRRFEEELARWRRTGICGNCGFYEVQDSLWMRELAIDDEEVRHYFSVGRRVSVDVLARGWSWRVERSVPDAPPPLWPPG